MDGTIGLIQAGLGTAVTGLSVMDSVLERIGRINDKRLSTHALLRAYYFEVLSNLEFLEVVDFSKLDGLKPGDPHFGFIMANIHNDIGFAVLFKEKPEESPDLLAFFNSRGKLERNEEEKGPAYSNVLQAISFTVVKTEILKRLASMPAGEAGMLSTISVKIRLHNIRQRFLIIKDKMDGLPALKKLAR